MTHSMQSYMEKHKIGPLFEELMNKVLRDAPDDPLIYLLKAIYKKTGLELPQELKGGGPRKSADHELNRSYDKPWMTQVKKLKPKKSGEDIQMSKARKQRGEWNKDNKVKVTSFDDMWEEHQPMHRDEPVRHSEPATSYKRAWAKVGLEEDGMVYSSHGYSGPSHNRENVDPLASEFIPVSTQQDEAELNKLTARSSMRHQKTESRQHRAQLEKMLIKSDDKAMDSGYTGESDEEQDDGIELLEDPDELANEGVTKISKSGYRLSKILRERRAEPQVKLNIHLFPSPERRPTVQNTSREYRDYAESSVYESDEDRVQSPVGQSGVESDDEFESVSQVVGPRKPVWNIPDSDGESFFAPRPGFSSPPPTKSVAKRKYKHGGLASTLPADGKPFSYTTDPLQTGGREGLRTWAPGVVSNSERVPPVPTEHLRSSVQSERGGWVLPDDSDASVTDDASRSRTYRMDPRAY